MAKPKRAAKQTKKPTRNPAPKPTRPRTAAAPTPAAAPEPESTLPAVRSATPERAFVARFKPPAPSPPLPSGRRAIFVDVENSSRADHVSRVLDHLAIDRQGRRGRRRGRGGGGGGGRPDHAPRAPMPPRAVAHHAPAPAAADGPAHTAPLDELVDIVRELAQRSPNGSVLIDTLARSLKERGFSRPPNSPRLITRLRRIPELAVCCTGMITLVGVSGPPGDARRDEGPEPAAQDSGPRDVEAETDGDAGPEPGNEADQEPGAPPPDGAPGRPRRRGRRRGRRRRAGGAGGGG